MHGVRQRLLRRSAADGLLFVGELVADGSTEGVLLCDKSPRHYPEFTRMAALSSCANV